MKTEHINLTTQLNRLRWIVPIALAIVGVGYILYRKIFSSQRPILSGDIFLAFLVLVVVGPVCTWLALSSASGTAQSEAAAKIEAEKP